jgi:hypothetical protein
MKTRTQIALLAVGLSTAATALAQGPYLQGHYIPGVEGIQAATLPPAGLYVRDYNYTYWANRFNMPDGSQAPGDFNAVVYANVPRVVWMTGKKIFGADFGMDALIPLVYKNIEGVGNHFSAGDACFEPVLLSWHLNKFDIAAGYAFYAPTAAAGTVAAGQLDAGSGFWTQMITFGGTWYADAKKTWSISALNRYEFNSIQRNTGLRAGQVYTLEYGVAKALTPTLKFGAAGYYQTQTTLDSGDGASTARDSVAAIGPEITYDFPKIMLFTSLRYEREFFANDRPQGNVVTLTITKRF